MKKEELNTFKELLALTKEGPALADAIMFLIDRMKGDKFVFTTDELVKFLDLIKKVLDE